MTTTVRGFRDFILERVPEWNSLDLERKHFALRQILAQPGLVLINLVPHFSHLVNPIPVIPSVYHLVNLCLAGYRLDDPLIGSADMAYSMDTIAIIGK